MFRIYDCIAYDHDVRLILLAGAVCLLASLTAFSLLARSGPRAGARAAGWLAAAGFVAGAGIWATHFIAMLAFRSDMPVSYDIPMTLLSIVAAILFALAGFAVTVRFRRPALGGAIVGFGAGVMHYTGMAALVIPAVQIWDPFYVGLSLALGMALSAAALPRGLGAVNKTTRLSGVVLLALAICALHFTGMAAMRLQLDPTVTARHDAMPAMWLGITIALVTLFILALGLFGALVDAHLADRAGIEADRLRRHVAELERMKLNLEASTLQLSAALEAAAAGSQAKSQFLAAMSHELRTPLNAIIGFSDLLLLELYGPLGDPRYKDYVADISHSGKHLLGLINDVLDLSKIDAQHLELDEEIFDLSRLLSETAALMRHQAEKENLSLAVETAAAPVNIRGDARRFRQIMLNLLSNALKFTPSGGQVTVSLARHDQGVDIRVADTGIGMAARDIPVALERFGQIDSRLSRNYDGTGLGLPLSKRLIELHGGRLDIQSAPGIGTTVAVFVPAQRVIDPGPAHVMAAAG